MPCLRVGRRDRDYLEKVTALMVACRGEDPLDGMWDAGDLQWWWRDGRYQDPENQMFWEEGDSRPLGLALVDEEFRCFDYEILPSLGRGDLAREVFGWGLARLQGMAAQGAPDASYGVFVRDDDRSFRAMAESAGFVPEGPAFVQTTLDLRRPLPKANVPEGFLVRPICESDLLEGAPPVLDLSAHEFERVRGTPHYREQMHLVAATDDGNVASECICWVDDSNGIGVFEPVRTADTMRRRGLAAATMTTGLRMMADGGLVLAKVSHVATNEPAARAYGAVGFTRAFERIQLRYRRPTAG